MSFERLEELLWEKIDGTIDGSGEDLIEGFTSEDPQAIDRQRSVRSLSKLLGNVELIDPPPELRTRLLEAIREPLSAPISFVLPEKATRLASRSRVMRLSYLAAGILIGVLASRLVIPAVDNGRPMEASQLAATMGSDLAGESVQGLVLSLEPMQGELELWHQANRVIVELRLDEPTSALLSLQGEGHALALEDVWREGGSTSELIVRKQEVSLSVVGGGRYRISVNPGEDDSPELLVRISTESHLILKIRVSVDGLPEIPLSNTNF